MGLTELLIVIAVIGVMGAVTFPVVGRVFRASKDAKARANARSIESISASLAGLGVAHVIPESLGGVEATARLLRVGVIVPDGPMAGQKYIVAALSDEDIADVAKYLRVEYDEYELRLVYIVDSEGVSLKWNWDGPNEMVQIAYFRKEPILVLKDPTAANV